MNPYFISTEEALQKATSALSRVFNGTRTLIQLECNIDSPRAVLIEFGVVFADDFFEVINCMATGDASIFFISIDPTPEKHRDLLGVYGVIEHHRPLTSGSYFDSLLQAPGVSEVDCPEAVWDTFAMVGDSGDWGFWVERWEGIAALLISQDVSRTVLDHLTGRSLPMNVAESIMALERGVEVLSETERRAFRSIFNRITASD